MMWKTRLSFLLLLLRGEAFLAPLSPTKEMPSLLLRLKSSAYGDWEPSSDGGSYVLLPKGQRPKKTVVHFIGGAFVGAASQLTYRYLLERLAVAGYAVVATPYRLSFDYETTCEGIERSFAESAAELEYDEVVGVGHSCGALLHALMATKSPRRKRLALISYNNKGATDAVPLFDEVVVPFATTAATQPLARRAAETLRGAADVAIEALENPPLEPPAAVREIAERLGLRQIARQSLELADQLPDLLGELADGAREFDPPPQVVRQRLRTSFLAEDALVLQFQDDAIDESDDLYAALRDATGNPSLALKRLPGTHLTPLTQDIFLPAQAVADVAKAAANGNNGPFAAAGNNGGGTVAATIEGALANAAEYVNFPRDQWLSQVDATFQELEEWLRTDDDDDDKAPDDQDDDIPEPPVEVVDDGDLPPTD